MPKLRLSALLLAACFAGCKSSSPATSTGTTGGGTTPGTSASSGSSGTTSGSTSGGSSTTTGGSSGSSGTTGAPVAFFPDVAQIMSARCTNCHNGEGIAPFTLLSYQDALAHKDQIRAYVATKLMPPWPPGPDCNSYQHPRNLSDAEIATITSWVDQGAGEGSPVVEPLDIPDAGPPLSRVDLSVSLPEAYTPSLSPDDYHCFVVDPQVQQTAYVTGVSVRPGNPKIVHHVIAYLAGPGDAATYDAIDGGSTVGYTCFGGPGGDDSANWLAAWAPGTVTGDFPSGTGIKIEPGSRIILQVHYNVLNGPGESDQTQVDMRLDPSVQHEAAVIPFTDYRWPSGNMPIPANDPDAGAWYDIDPTPYMGLVTNNVIPNGPFRVWTVGAHMHLRGHSERLDIERADGGNTCLLDVPDWDFHWQGGYQLVQPETVSSGDKLRIQCHWDNSQANQPYYADGGQEASHPLNWGDGTDDEMCLGILYVTQ